MTLKTKIILVVTAAVAFVCLTGCGSMKPDYGVYNLGVCPDAGPFIESNVDVEAQTFSIIASAMGPDMVEKYPQPLVLKFVVEADGLRKYVVQINGHEDEVYVRVEKGQLEGSFNINNKLVAKLHGHKGSLENLGADGTQEAKACLGE